MRLSRLLIVSACFCVCGPVLPVWGQSIPFRNLGTEEGMKTLTSWHCTYDQFGQLWVSTSDGLMRYDGHEVHHYYTSSHPAMASDQTGYLFCDSRNRIWVCSGKGLTCIDEDRNPVRHHLFRDDPDREVSFCVEDSRGYLTAISRGQAFQLNPSGSEWKAISWLDTLLGDDRVRDIKPYDEDQFLFVLPSRGVLIVDLKREIQTAFFPMPGVQHAIHRGNGEIFIAGRGPFSLYQVAVQPSEVLQRIPGPGSIAGGDVKSEIEHLAMATNGKLYMATDGAGLIEYDPATESFQQFLHDPANPLSIADNTLRYITADSLGHIACTSLSGVIYTNVNYSPVTYINYFRTDDGEVYDDRVVSITEDSLRQLWVATERAVIVVSTDRKHMHKLAPPPGMEKDRKPGIVTCMATDHYGKIWIAFSGAGIGICSPDQKWTRMLTSSAYPGFGNRMLRARMMIPADDGYMYIGAENGFFRISQDDYRLDTFPEDPALQPLRHARVVDILPAKDHLWVSTSPSGAAWHYNLSNKSLTKYTVDNGLLSNRVYGLERDDLGNVYVGTYSGLSILHPDGTFSQKFKGEGLPSTRIDAMVKAPDGTIWMTNNYNLLRYDPVEQEMITIGGHPGFSRVNYQIMSSAALSSGELAFGAHKGMVLVDSRQAIHHSTPLHLYVFYKNADGHEYRCTSDKTIRLQANESLLRFSFSVQNLMLSGQMVYRYRISSGSDGQWSEPSYLARVDMNLSPGSYLMEVEAFDGQVWHRGESPFRIRVAYPWWRKGWVVALFLLGLTSGLWWYVRARIQSYKQQMEVSRQIAELESKALKAQMNPHFVFNSLNAIQECIVTGRVDEAYSYLTAFSRLLRLVLEHSEMTEVSLQEELEVLSLYLSLEKLRFKKDMQMDIITGEDLDVEEIYIPPMLIQPHIENAIWHGLRNRDGEKKLSLSIGESIPGYLQVQVTDNGIGRRKAEEIRLARIGSQRQSSKGKQLTINRLELLKHSYPFSKLEYTDLYHDDGSPAGTRVELTIPIMPKTKHGPTG